MQFVGHVLFTEIPQCREKQQHHYQITKSLATAQWIQPQGKAHIKIHYTKGSRNGTC